MLKHPEKLPYEEFKKIYARVPRLCVDLVFESPEGIVLIERAIDPGKGCWHLPGGTMLMGESVEATIKRVASEETGLIPSAYDLAGYLEFNEPDNAFFHTVSLVFRIKNFKGTLKGGEQGENIRFHSRLPGKIIEAQKDFLLKAGLFKK